MKIKYQDLIVKVAIWDPAGQERFESITKGYIQKLDGILLVFDITNDNTFHNVLKWLQQLNNVSDKPILITANKVDKSDHAVSSEDIQLLQEKTKVKCYHTSALTGYNVDQVFTELIELIINGKLSDEKSSMMNSGQIKS